MVQFSIFIHFIFCLSLVAEYGLSEKEILEKYDQPESIDTRLNGAKKIFFENQKSKTSFSFLKNKCIAKGNTYFKHISLDEVSFEFFKKNIEWTLREKKDDRFIYFSEEGHRLLYTKFFNYYIIHIESAEYLKNKKLFEQVTLPKNDKKEISEKEIDKLLATSDGKSLALSNCIITDKQLNHISKLKSLVKLQFHFCEISGLDFQKLSQLPNLNFLFLNKTELTNTDLIEIRKFKVLQKLLLTNNKINFQNLKFLKGLPIVHLNLSSTTVDDSHLPDLAGMKLLNLDLSSTNINGSGLIQLKGMPLEKLNLTNTAINNEGFNNLQHFLNLKHLILNKVKLTEESLNYISKLQKIEYLALGWTGITDNQFAKIKDLNKIETLFLEGTKITEKSIEIISNFPKLKTIWLPKWNNASIKKLKTLIPNCDIQF